MDTVEWPEVVNLNYSGGAASVVYVHYIEQKDYIAGLQATSFLCCDKRQAIRRQSTY